MAARRRSQEAVPLVQQRRIPTQKVHSQPFRQEGVCAWFNRREVWAVAFALGGAITMYASLAAAPTSNTRRVLRPRTHGDRSALTMRPPMPLQQPVHLQLPPSLLS